MANEDPKLKEKLSPSQYKIMREKGTELPFTGKYWNNHEKGVYKCAACGAVLFDSSDKFDSGTGWPSFSKARGKVVMKEDKSMFMNRTEAVCPKCGSHLGHVFDDGPEPTGKRFCINSAALDFKEK